MKIVTIIGARPQFIKAAMISEEIRKGRHCKKIREVIVNTGQHYDYNMSKSFFTELNIPKPDYDLNVGSAPHIDQIAEMMRKIEVVIKKERPDAVLVYGDTNSTLAGAIVSGRLNIPLYHIEAGLRSYDKSMPEEMNRVLTDHLSKLLFCPTRQSVDNLKKENISKGAYLVGDIMYDLALKMLPAATRKSDILKKLGIKRKKYILATIHRESNTDIRRNLNSIVSAFCGVRHVIIFPLHPRTRKMLKKFKLLRRLESAKNVKIIPPVGYMDMIYLEKNAHKIITDSGGVQKEAYFFKVPCITLRENSEWTETLKSGWNTLVGPNVSKISKAIEKKIIAGVYLNHYGDGKASEKIINRMIKGRAS